MDPRWMDARSVWIFPSPNEPTPQLPGSTWEDQRQGGNGREVKSIKCGWGCVFLGVLIVQCTKISGGDR